MTISLTLLIFAIAASATAALATAAPLATAAASATAAPLATTIRFVVRRRIYRRGGLRHIYFARVLIHVINTAGSPIVKNAGIFIAGRDKQFAVGFLPRINAIPERRSIVFNCIFPRIHTIP